ncbi:hypothetical protein ABZ027_36995 [Streptomyces sp. NPDC006332]|uniref:hypothetical protein n=1 Tax=Streptomyces sp. NPDC006332 TaxID=3155456 RepID=UPI0033A90064
MRARARPVAATQAGQRERLGQRRRSVARPLRHHPEVTVPAGAEHAEHAEHAASIGWAPASDGRYDLTVCAATRFGIQLAPYDYYFTVN